MAYLKLKYLHKQYWQTLRDFHRWHRWYSKEPQNRIGAEPKYCPIFVDDCRWRKAVQRNGEVGFKWYSRSVNERNVVRMYQKARMPAVESIEAFSDKQLAEIETLYQIVKEYFAN